MNNITTFISTTANIAFDRDYLLGGLKGTFPHAMKMAPKKLFEWTKYRIFGLFDISYRMYRNIPEKNTGWLKWTTKSTLLTASTIKMLKFFKLLPKSLAYPIDLFMLFSTGVSGLKSLSKGTSLLGKVAIPLPPHTNDAASLRAYKKQKSNCAENAVSGLFYCAFSAAKIASFAMNMYLLYLSFKTDDYAFTTDCACYDTKRMDHTPHFTGLFDTTY